MEKCNALATMMILICFCVDESFSACSKERNGFVEGFLGRNVTLSCKKPLSCRSIHWMNHTMIPPTIVSPHDTSHTSIDRPGRISFLRIYGVVLDDVGRYSCWCGKDLRVNGNAICSATLSAICQTTVRLHRVNILYNGSNISPSSLQAMSVTAEDTIRVTCSEGATSETNCHRVTAKDSSARFTYDFRVLPEHHLCYIACIERGQVGKVCTVNISLNVSIRGTTTPFSTLSTTPSTTFTKFVEKTVHTSMSGFLSKNEGGSLVTDKPGTFPVITFVGVFMFILLVVTFVTFVCILFSRSRSNSRSKENITSVNSLSNATILIGPIYESVDNSLQGPKTEDGESVSTGRKAISPEDFYSEVSSAGKEESTIQQTNTDRAVSPITNDFYSVVNTSNETMGTLKCVKESDSTLYSEVNKRETQSRRSKYSSSLQNSICDPIIPKPYQGLEQSTLSDNNTVSDISTSQALYAVIGKDKGKE